MTEGEQHFKEYVSSLNVTAVYEPHNVGGKERRRPVDYCVHFPSGDILCELKDFDRSKVDIEMEKQIKESGRAARWLDPLVRIRTKIDEASAKFKEYKGEYPCTLVLYNSCSLSQPLRDVDILGAMYGDVALVLPNSESGQLKHENAVNVFRPEKSKMNEVLYSVISAIAVLEYIQPNQDRLIAEAGSSGHEVCDDMNKVISLILNQMKRHPEFNARVIRLRIYHNCYAQVQLPITVFNGSYDQHFVLDSATRCFKKVETPRTAVATK